MVAMRSSLLLLSMSDLLCITCALPSKSFPSLQLPNNTITTTTANRSLSYLSATSPLHAGRSIECFAPGTPRTDSVIVEDCDFVIEAILRDPAGAMAVKKFSHQAGVNEFEVPGYWGIGGCVVILNSGDASAEDTFRLVDVIIKAREIIAECPGKSKTHLGGIALIGHGKTFFVAVNGPFNDPDDPHLERLGERRSGTGLGLTLGGRGNGTSGVEGRRGMVGDVLE